MEATMNDQTNAIHFGYEKDSQGTMAVPIYMTTAYEFRDSLHASNLFSLKELGNIYTRLMNPTTSIFERRFAEIEGGISAIATASGMSAIFSSIVNLCESGDNVIVASAVYGGTSTLTGHTIKRMGIETRTFDVTNPSNIEFLIDNKTKAIIFESLSNPSLAVADFDKIVEIANKHNIIIIVDNTVATPYLCKPIKLGCDVVVHSTSKYTGGQGLALGGIIVEGASCNDKIKNNPRYSHFNEPDESYHGLIYSSLPFPSFTMRLLLCVLRDLGASASPFNSWLLIQGLETLSLRIKEHSKNALKIAQFLDAHPKIKKVNYPLLASDKNYGRATKYLNNGASGLLSFEVESYEEALRIADGTDIFKVVVNIGDSKSLIVHPASTTHSQMSKDELANAGISDTLVRLSVGFEDCDDLIKDLEKAIG
jgi:O-acetylhomoserine (thiol)-lyase